MTISDATDLFTGVLPWLSLYGGVWASQLGVLYFREMLAVTMEG